MSRICNRCGDHSEVKDSRAIGDITKRRRACISCGHRWNTFELREEHIDQVKLNLALQTVMENLDE